MFKKILRDYRYISRDSPLSESRKTVIRGESFPVPELPDFRNQTGIRRTDSGRRSPGRPVKEKFSGPKSAEIDAKPPRDKQPAADDRISLSSQELAERIRMAQDEAYNKGIQAGIAAGRAEWEPTAKQLSAAFESAIRQCQERHQALAEEFEKSLYELSMNIARKVIGDAAVRSSDAAAFNVKNCLSMMGGSGEVTIKLSPSDIESIRASLPDFEKMNDGRFRINLISDESITPGGCFVELDGSIIDARIDSQLDNIKKHLSVLS